METSIWVVGVGPIIVNRQFLVDIGRRAVEWYLNGKSIPKDPRDALLLLYEPDDGQFDVRACATHALVRRHVSSDRHLQDLCVFRKEKHD